MLSAKAKLYRSIDQLRERLSVPINQSINVVELLDRVPRIDVEYIRFKTPGLCGVAMVGSKIDTIILNENRGICERNFDCAHELLHLYLHRNIQDHFNCFTSARQKQNTFIEWQANEGAAQFLVPYQDFIPRYNQEYEKVLSYCVNDILADHYNVTPQVIIHRVSNLKQEFRQYENGVPIERINLVSNRQAREQGNDIDLDAAM